MALMQVIGTLTIVTVALALSNHSTKVNIYNSQATSALYKLSDVPSLDGIGVTSILSENTCVAKSEGKGGGSKTKTIYVGTKRGKLKEVKWSDSDSYCTGTAFQKKCSNQGYFVTEKYGDHSCFITKIVVQNSSHASCTPLRPMQSDCVLQGKCIIFNSIRQCNKNIQL